MRVERLERSVAGEAVAQIEIVINGQSSNFPPGMDETSNPYLDYIRGEVGLDIRVIAPPPNSYDDALNLIMSSGKGPDMINSASSAFFSDHVKRGLLKPLNDAIDRNGQDLKRLIPQEAWDQVTYDGRIYAIPSLNEVRGTEILYIRKDWLDNVGLKLPTTLVQLEKVMRAFKHGDPDKNGQDDTIGWVIAEQLGRTAPIFGAFGTQQQSWLEQEGKLVYSGILPQTKETLAVMNKWYKEGLIDPDFLLNKPDNLRDKVASGKAGLFSAAWFDTRGPIEESIKNDPNAQWVPLDYPTGPRGESGTYSLPVVRSYNVVPADSDHASEVVRLLNFIVGEGSEVLKLGFKNEVWTERDDRLAIDFEKHNLHLYRGIYSSLCDAAHPEATRKRLDLLGERFRLWDNVRRIHENLIESAYGGPPTPSMGRHNISLLKLQHETYMKLVTGLLPIDAFDEFVYEWKRRGGDSITEEVNVWYQRPFHPAVTP
ncbi:extracellular solute-binding protein [Paenibacillus sp. GYB004]|uniref:extracellular solute-binding protein n=1 Tax=Paenibacillus sp. GYB004 TaxID=2994393 RepID=UPI002F964581